MRPDTITVQAAATVRAADAQATAGPRMLDGVLATYGETVHPYGPWYAVRLAKGAFEIPTQLSDVKMLADHDRSRVIGVLDTTDDQGDSVTGALRFGRTQAANEAFMQAEDGILDGLSVGYRVIDGRDLVEDGKNVFEVTRAALFEVSLVAWPADSTARVTTVTASSRGTDLMNALPAPPVVPTQPQPATLTDAQLDSIAAALGTRMAPVPSVNPVPGSEARIATVTATERPGRYPAARGRDGKLYTAGDYFSAYHGAINSGQWDQFRTIQAALADELTSDVPGLLPTAIIGELLGRAVGRRDVWDSLRSRDMPMLGAEFSRPKITQHVDVARQLLQKTQVATRKMTVELEPVAKQTLAGALDIAVQVIDWTAPSFINEVVVDFVAIYLAATNSKAATDLVAAQVIGAQSVVWDGTAPTLVKALAEAAGLVINGVDPEMESAPNTVWLSIDQWVALAGLIDTTGRPLLPSVGPMNASGQIDLSTPQTGVSGMGFRWVVSKKLPAGTFIMGDSTYTESYENGRRFLRADRPDTLGLDLAYMGYTATYFPYPKTLVSIAPATPPAEPLATTPPTTTTK